MVGGFYLLLQLTLLFPKVLLPVVPGFAAFSSSLVAVGAALSYF